VAEREDGKLEMKIKKDIDVETLKKSLIYYPDTGIFIRINSKSNSALNGSVAGSKDRYGYIKIRVEGVLYLAHRLAWLYVYGTHPKNYIDHINMIVDDNRISNLREATGTQNQFNKPHQSNSKSGIRGVSFDAESGKWKAQIGVNKTRVTIGRFKDINEAKEAYNDYAKKLHGEFYKEIV